MKKLLTVLAFCLGFTLFGTSPVNASPINIADGDVVKTADNPNVYIIKQGTRTSYKRLILSPNVFRSYGHLKWSNVKVIPQDQINTYMAVTTVRVAGESTVYSLMGELDGDGGMKAALNTSDIFDWDCVYTINHTDASSYRLTTHDYYMQDQNRQEALERISHAHQILQREFESYNKRSQDMNLSEQERIVAENKAEEVRTILNQITTVYIKITDGRSLDENDIKFLQAQAFFTNELDPYSGLGFLLS